MSDDGFYLLENRNPHGPHFYDSRLGSVLAIVLHITAGLEGNAGRADHSAEGTARYAATTDRPVSWHSGSDTDSLVKLLPASYTAFQCRGYNSRTYGHEISKRDTDWAGADPSWVTLTLSRAADHLGDVARALGVPFRHASKAELDHAIATGGGPVGFVYHWQLDPTRRTDPGKFRGHDTFPMDRFLRMAAGAQPPPGPPLTPDQIEELVLMSARTDILAAIERSKPFAKRINKTATHVSGALLEEGEVWVIGPSGMYHVQRATLNTLYISGVIRPDDDQQPGPIDGAQLVTLPIIPAA